MMGLSRHDVLRPLLRAICIGLGYFISAGIGASFLVQPQSIAGFWPASGLLVGALVISRTQSWPPILTAVLAATLVINLLLGKSLGVSVAFAFVNALEGVLGAWLLLRCCGPCPRMSRVRDVLGLVVLAGLVSPALASTLATVVIVMEVGASYFWHVWYAWWVADTLGVVKGHYLQGRQRVSDRRGLASIRGDADGGRVRLWGGGAVHRSAHPPVLSDLSIPLMGGLAVRSAGCFSGVTRARPRGRVDHSPGFGTVRHGGRVGGRACPLRAGISRRLDPHRPNPGRSPVRASAYGGSLTAAEHICALAPEGRRRGERRL